MIKLKINPRKLILVWIASTENEFWIIHFPEASQKSEEAFFTKLSSFFY